MTLVLVGFVLHILKTVSHPVQLVHKYLNFMKTFDLSQPRDTQYKLRCHTVLVFVLAQLVVIFMTFEVSLHL